MTSKSATSLVVHALPLDAGECTLFELNLDRRWAALRISMTARGMRSGQLPPLPPLDTARGSAELEAILDGYGIEAGDVVVLDSMQRVTAGPENDADTARNLGSVYPPTLRRRSLSLESGAVAHTRRQELPRSKAYRVRARHPAARPPEKGQPMNDMTAGLPGFHPGAKLHMHSVVQNTFVLGAFTAEAAGAIMADVGARGLLIASESRAVPAAYEFKAVEFSDEPSRMGLWEDIAKAHGGYLAESPMYLTGLTARGRRAVGLWPSAETLADQVIANIDGRIQQATTAEERSKWVKFRDGVVGGGRDLLVEVMASVVSRQINGQ